MTPTGGISHSAGPQIWQPYAEACELAKRLEVGAQEGGLAFLLPKLTDTAPASALFFTLPPLPPFTIAPGPIEALGSAVPTPLGPFAAGALDTLAATALAPGTLPPASSPPVEMPWQLPAGAIPPGRASVWPPDPLLESMATLSEWVYAYVPLTGKWCWLKVALAPNATPPAGRKGQKPERQP
jgi:hypothetical protein